MTIATINKYTALFGNLMRLDKPIGNWLLLWPMFTALWLASQGTPSLRILALFIAGAFIMRASGCIINDIWDRNIDNKVARTLNRPLANNALSLTAAGVLLTVLLLAALIIVLMLNTLSLILAMVALGLSILYPSAKRWCPCPQLILGLTFNSGVLIAYAATQNSLPLNAWLLYGISCLWTILYDTQYALSDIQDDIKLNLRSSAILFGQHNALVLKLFQIILVILLSAFGAMNHLDTPYWLAVVIVFLLFIYQSRLTRGLQPQQCLKAFHRNHWAWLALFIGVVLQFIFYS